MDLRYLAEIGGSIAGLANQQNRLIGHNCLQSELLFAVFLSPKEFRTIYAEIYPR